MDNKHPAKPAAKPDPASAHTVPAHPAAPHPAAAEPAMARPGPFVPSQTAHQEAPVGPRATVPSQTAKSIPATVKPALVKVRAVAAGDYQGRRRVGDEFNLAVVNATAEHPHGELFSSTWMVLVKE